MFWTVAGPVISTVGLIAGGIVGTVKWLRGRQIVICQLTAAVPVLDRAKFGLHAATPDLAISHKGHKLANPHLVQIRIYNRSYRNIPSAEFDQNHPLKIDLGAPITALLDTVCQPSDSRPPVAAIHGTALDVGPALLRHRSVITYYLLADGEVKRLELGNPFIRANARYTKPQAYPPQGMPAKKIIAWAVIIFLLYYLVTTPRGAEQAMISLWDALKHAGSSLATFLNSL